MEKVKLVVTTPIEDAEKVRKALADAGAGKIGNYDSCSFAITGTGRFRPLEGSNPHIGTQDELEELEEERLEVTCERARIQEIIAAVREAHPYEEPVIDVYPLLNVNL